MRWSWKLGSIAGIRIHIHATFLILLAWVGLIHYAADRSLAAAAVGVAFIVAIFATVVLHELGHALMARRFGIRTRDITLLPIGGVSRLERMPREPWREFLVAITGPSVNVALAAIILGALLLTNAPLLPVDHLSRGQLFLARLLWANVALAIFNLLPAFPMDGGRILRAFLATSLDYTRATQIAASTGQMIALLFGFLGLLFNPLLVFIALFVWLGAAEEAAMVQMTSALGGIPVSAAMITNFRTLERRDPLSRAVEHVLAGSQQDLPVVADDVVVGVLTRGRLLESLARRGKEALVGDVMESRFETADASEMLEPAFARLRECDCHALPVLDRGRLVGMLTPDNVSELLLVQAALRRHEAPRGRRGAPRPLPATA